LTPREVYPNSEDSLLIIYDMRWPGGAQRFVHDIAGRQGPLKMEPVDRHHWALTLHPGPAGKITSPRPQDEDRTT
jgi:hypothetical protein